MNHLVSKISKSNLDENLVNGKFPITIHDLINREQYTSNNKVNGKDLPDFILLKEYKPTQSIEKPNNHQRTTLYIRNMVSIRCKMVVKSILEDLGFHCSYLELGKVEIIGNFNQIKHDELNETLLKYGLELMDDKNKMLIENIKTIIIELIHYSDDLQEIIFSKILSEKLNHDYTHLSTLFSEITGTTIEHFIIVHKIERAKELMVYDDTLSLNDIAWQLNYSSVAHLSNQFKKITGLTPTHFKNMQQRRFV